MNLNEYSELAHKNAKEKGFYEVEDSIINFGVGTREGDLIDHTFFAQKIALIHSELSEAIEADRHGKKAIMENIDFANGDFKIAFEQNIKDTVEDEIADTFIRLFDLCGRYNIDIEFFVNQKMKYNSLREKMHNKKY
ncbi:MAG: hypothetical protein LBM67_08345 [Lentimicrobiaceae bacterium]|jgi:NTP pyrophosphatase (non-canonical NTP hydrolase)|nr:hypothetical protein [Lentimicrobiaceae bacterium]